MTIHLPQIFLKKSLYVYLDLIQGVTFYATFQVWLMLLLLAQLSYLHNYMLDRTAIFLSSDYLVC